MMSEAKAKILAAKAGLSVSSVRITNLVDARCGAQATIRELTVGLATCSYDTRTGGAACWRVRFDGIECHGGFKGEAIEKAVALQTASPPALRCQANHRAKPCNH